MFEHLALHKPYLERTLSKEVSSAYAALEERELEERELEERELEERELEEHCEEGSWEEDIEAVRVRKPMIGFLGEVMQDASVSAGLPEEVRLFLGEVLESHPDLDIRLLANARRRRRSEEGREELTRAMRELM